MGRVANFDRHRERQSGDLLRVARALYEAALHEESPKRLEILRLVAVEFAQAVDEAVNIDGALHPDLGTELVLFIELKRDGNPEAEADRKDVVRILEGLEGQARE